MYGEPPRDDDPSPARRVPWWRKTPSRLELTALGWTLLTLVAVVLALYGGGAYDSTDSPTARSGLALHIDHGEGCHYLVTWFGGITPRMRADGTQVCTGAEEDGTR